MEVKRYDRFYAFLFIVIAVLCIVMVVAIARDVREKRGRGSITVYGAAGQLEHFDDAEWRWANDSMVVIRCGDRKVTCINCNVEVKE